MKELLDDIDRWRAAGARVAIARVVDIEGSGPREPGAAMAVNEHGEVAGSVSGGCVEGAVVVRGAGDPARRGRAAHRHVRLQRRRGVRRRPHVRRHHPPVHRTARLVTDVVAVYELLRDRLRAEQPVALVTVDRRAGRRRQAARRAGAEHRSASLGNPELDRIVGTRRAGRARGRPQRRAPLRPPRRDDAGGPGRHARSSRVFIESWAPPPQMWIFGAVDFTAALAKVAKVLGYRVTVCDAREIFATRRRFPMADEVVVSWPGPVFDAARPHARPPRRRVHPHPRPEVRRAGGAGRARPPTSATSA